MATETTETAYTGKLAFGQYGKVRKEDGEELTLVGIAIECGFSPNVSEATLTTAELVRRWNAYEEMFETMMEIAYPRMGNEMVGASEGAAKLCADCIKRIEDNKP